MLVCVFLCKFAHETAGAARIRLSLRPLVFLEGVNDAKLGRLAPRQCEAMSARGLTIESELGSVALLRIATDLQLEHSLEAMRCRFQRCVDIRGTVR